MAGACLQHLVAAPMRYLRSGNAEGFSRFALAQEKFDSCRLRPFGAEVLAYEKSGPIIISQFPEGGGARTPNHLRCEQDCDLTLSSRLVQRSSVAKHVAKHMVQVGIIVFTPHQLKCDLVRFDQIPPFRAMNGHLCDRIEGVRIESEFLVQSSVGERHDLGAAPAETRIR